MTVRENVSLKNYNTFGIDVNARYFVSVSSVKQLKEILADKTYDSPLIIGGGSNMLLTKNVDKLVIHLNFKGIEVVEDSSITNTVLLKVAGGENWHDLVLYTVDNDFGGLENLSLIPGNVGTSPIQNIGAYGVELKDTFYECEAIHREHLQERTFSLEACAFGYRDSVFKNALKNQYIITSVIFKLTKEKHVINIAYGAIAETLQKSNITKPTLKDVSQAVIAIRQAKLPDPTKIGNSGSFFKNPIITQKHFSQLREEFPEIPYYPIGDNNIKVPAGWLIEQAGFKGKRFGDAGVHDKQALVLVNHGSATGQEIWDLARNIQEVVQTKFGIKIQAEVNII